MEHVGNRQLRAKCTAYLTKMQRWQREVLNPLHQDLTREVTVGAPNPVLPVLNGVAAVHELVRERIAKKLSQGMSAEDLLNGRLSPSVSCR
jgi:hypothetical protein